MKTNNLILLAVITLCISGCRSKKSVTTTSSTPVVTIKPATTDVPATVASGLAMPARSTTGIYAPGNEELVAIQVQYNDVTLDKLKEGYTVYTEGACIKCHGAKSIYQREELRWKKIIDDMARMANISEEQKDAVYKYVLAIKATQAK